MPKKRYTIQDGQLFISFHEVASILRELGGAANPTADPGLTLYQTALLFLDIEKKGKQAIQEEVDRIEAEA